MSSTTRRGRCVCGGIRFTVSGAMRDVIDCHCHRCRRFTGHHMAATSAPAAEIDVDDPGSLLTWFRAAEESHYAFCGRCGSSLFWQGCDLDRRSICAGVLEPPTGLRTVAAWWTSDASDYHELPQLPQFETEPGDG